MSLITELSPENSALIFVNPAAGAGQARGATLAQMRSLAARRGWPVELRLTQTAADLEKCVEQAVRDGRTVLIAMGGDGTFQSLINAAAGANVVLGVIPCGEGNDFARSLGLPRNPLLALDKIVYGKPRRVDLALATTDDGKECYYAGGGGVGLDARAAHYAYKRYRKVPGRLRYVMAALHAYKNFEPITVTIEFPGGDHAGLQCKVLLASVLNTPIYGGGLRIAPDAKIDDGMLDVVLVENLKIFEVAALLPALLASGHLETPHIKRIRTSRVHLSTDRPCQFHGDGELLGAAPVEVKVIPGAVQVLAPADEKTNSADQ